MLPADVLRILPMGVAWCAKNALGLSVVIALLFVAAAVLIRNVGDPVSSRQRRTATVVLLLLAGLALAIGGSPSLAVGNRWGFMLAFLPGAIIARHAVYMRLIRRRAMAAAVERPPALRRQRDRKELERKEPGLPLVFARARQMQDLDFAPDTLAIRYGVPALIATAIGIGVFATLRQPPEALQGINPQMIKAAQYGATGAMVYVLLYLAQRGFRNDITTGAATWSAVVLAVGPLFSAVLGIIWKNSAPADSPWTREALYFAAGMFPRHAASAVEEAVRRLWLARSPATPVQPRLQPLGQLRGITQSIEDRLTEEGIADVQGMAMADPLKLFRATSFDKRQILSWMDEALLFSWLPDHAATLQKIGVTGAIDLMAHVARATSEPDPDAEATSTARPKIPFSKTLKDAAKLEDAVVEAIMQAGAMLKEDAQLRLVWALYQFDEENLDGTADGADAQGVASPPGSTLTIPALGWLGAAAASIGGALLSGDCRIELDRAVVPVGFLMIAFAVALTVCWPWANRRRRVLPLVVAAALVVIGLVAWGRLAPVLAREWPARDAYLVVAAVFGGVFIARLIQSLVGATLTIDFPNGVPAECELSVDGRTVTIDRTGSPTAVCGVPGRSVGVVARYGGVEQRRWVDARGSRTLKMSFPLQAVVIVQVTPDPAVPTLYSVDGIDTKVGPLALWPRAAPYAIGVEADSFLRTVVSVVVSSAEVVPLPVVLPPDVNVRPGNRAPT